MQITKNQIINILLNLIIVSTIFLPFYNFEASGSVGDFKSAFSGGIKGTLIDEIFIVPLAAIISIGIILLNNKNAIFGGMLSLLASLYFILKPELMDANSYSFASGAVSASSSISIGLGLYLNLIFSVLLLIYSSKSKSKNANSVTEYKEPAWYKNQMKSWLPREIVEKIATPPKFVFIISFLILNMVYCLSLSLFIDKPLDYSIIIPFYLFILVFGGIPSYIAIYQK